MRYLFGSIFLCAALTATHAGAQSPAASPAPKPDTTSAASAPAPDTAPQGLPLASEPPGTDAGLQAAPGVEPPSPWQRLEPLLEELKVTDLVAALLALLITLAMLRIASAIGRLRKAVTQQTEGSRKVIEASEKAADSAWRSAEAAEKSVATLRDTAERQLRAYVTARQFIQAPMKDERGIHGWLLQVAWQNTGVTPTKGFRYWAMLREFDRAIPDDFEFTPPGLQDYAGGELGTNSSVNSPPLFVSQQLIAKLRDGSRKVLLLGQADYQDVLGNNAPRVTRFCVELMLVNDPGAAAGTPFSFTYHPKHNTLT